MKVAKWVEAPTGTFIKQSAKTGKRYVEDIFFIHTHLMWLLHVFWPHNRRHTCRLWVERGVTFENSSKRDPVCLVFLFSCYARVHTPPHLPRITTGRQQRMLLLSFLVFFMFSTVSIKAPVSRLPLFFCHIIFDSRSKSIFRSPNRSLRISLFARSSTHFHLAFSLHRAYLSNTAILCGEITTT